MLLDSNIIIYAGLPQYRHLQEFIEENSPAVSAISLVEVLGYHRLDDDARRDFEDFFDGAIILPVSEAVISKAVELRQQRKFSLGDSVIAATAIVNNLTLVTSDIQDFKWISGLVLHNPLAKKHSNSSINNVANEQ